MKKSLIALACVASIAGTATAKDLKVDVPPVHDLWWNAPDVPSLQIVVADTLGHANNAQLTVRVTTDRDKAHDVLRFSQSLKLAAGAADTLSVQLPMADPGFYTCFVEDDGNVVKQINFGYEPTNIVSLPDNPADFDEFWDTALAELAKVPVNYKLTEMPEKSGKKRKCYAVEMQSWGGETIKGYVMIPVAKGKYPTQIFYNGYGAKPNWWLGADDRTDWVEFVVSSRGQFLSEADNKYGDWIRYNLDKPAEYYYKGAFLDCVRAIDFVCLLDKVDTRNIFAEGGSQGGAYTYAAAALDSRLRAVAPYIPFLSDYRDYFRIVDWPASAVLEQARALGMSEEQMYNNLRYFDIKNFARRIKCPVLMGMGLQDPTCPPHTNMSSYNLLTVPKELKIYPLCGHTVLYDDWNPRRSAFFDKYILK
jgi:cephalosporin-C deacetylase